MNIRQNIFRIDGLFLEITRLLVDFFANAHCLGKAIFICIDVFWKQKKSTAEGAHFPSVLPLREEVLGPCAGWALNLVITAYTFGSICGYQVFLGQLGPQWLEGLGVHDITTTEYLLVSTLGVLFGGFEPFP